MEGIYLQYGQHNRGRSMYNHPLSVGPFLPIQVKYKLLEHQQKQKVGQLQCYACYAAIFNHQYRSKNLGFLSH